MERNYDLQKNLEKLRNVPMNDPLQPLLEACVPHFQENINSPPMAYVKNRPPLQQIIPAQQNVRLGGPQELLLKLIEKTGLPDSVTPELLTPLFQQSSSEDPSLPSTSANCLSPPLGHNLLQQPRLPIQVIAPQELSPSSESASETQDSQTSPSIDLSVVKEEEPDTDDEYIRVD